jgi:hypothetical protein
VVPVYDFIMNTSRAYYHAARKYCLRGTTFNASVGKGVERFDSCLGTQHGIQLGSGTSPTLSPLMA